MSKENSLPTINDLVGDLETYGKMDALNVLLNQEPPAKWIAQHPFIKVEKVHANGYKEKVPYEYLPIDKVEYLLRKIFKSYKIEITSNSTAFNGVVVTVRVHYKDIISGEWLFHDGIGADNLQTKSGKSPADLTNINNGALSMAYPNAKTLAIKDACDMFGKLFGADINRKDTIKAVSDKTILTSDDKKVEIERLLDLNLCDPITDGQIRSVIENENKLAYAKSLKHLLKLEAENGNR